MSPDPAPADPDQVVSTQTFLKSLRADGPSSEAPAVDFQGLGGKESSSTQVELDSSNT